MKRIWLLIVSCILILAAIIIVVGEADERHQVQQSVDVIRDYDNPDSSTHTTSDKHPKVVPPGITGWITIEDTLIDYPIVQGSDNDFYQSHDYNGDDNTLGAIFMDYRNASDCSDAYTLIYGHNGINHFMFSDLKYLMKYPNKEVTISMYKPNIYEEKYKVVAVSILNELSTIYELCDYDVMVAEIRDNSTYYESFTDSKVILLSTCYGRAGTNKRLVVVLKRL